MITEEHLADRAREIVSYLAGMTPAGRPSTEAHIVEILRAMRSDPVGSAALEPQEAVPVAWAYEAEHVVNVSTAHTEWEPNVSLRKPRWPNIRNVRPLYTHPSPDARRAAFKEAARIAYPHPSYAAFPVEKDAHGSVMPGSPYDRGRYDAAKAIREAADEAE